MGAEEEVLVTLSGGAPWGFRLQGGGRAEETFTGIQGKGAYIEVSGKGEPKGTWEESCGGLWGEKWEAVKKWSGGG